MQTPSEHFIHNVEIKTIVINQFYITHILFNPSTYNQDMLMPRAIIQDTYMFTRKLEVYTVDTTQPDIAVALMHTATINVRTANFDTFGGRAAREISPIRKCIHRPQCRRETLSQGQAFRDISESFRSSHAEDCLEMHFRTTRSLCRIAVVRTLGEWVRVITVEWTRVVLDECASMVSANRGVREIEGSE